MSRIPKFGFGFKKAKGQSTEEAPTKDDDVTPSEQEPANMKRSKSLRAPRPVVRSTCFSPTVLIEPGTQQPSLLQPTTVVSKSGAASNPGSRAASPYVAQPDDARNRVVSPTEMSGRPRATSVSAKQSNHTRSRSVVVKADRNAGPVVLGRSKTPTSMTRISSAPVSTHKLTRTSSAENTLTAAQSTPTSVKAPSRSPMTHIEGSTSSSNGRVTSPLGRSIDSKGNKVSRVLVMEERTADLNKLASEISKSLSNEQEEVDGAFLSKSGSLVSSGGTSDSTPMSPSSLTQPSLTPRSGLPAPRSVGTAKPLETSASKSRLAVPSIKVATSTGSANGGSPTSRPGSAKAYYSVQITPYPDDQERPHSVTAVADGVVPVPGVRRTSNDSSPSSGRNTPVELKTSLELDGSTKSSTSVDETPKVSNEIPRTPYRVPKVKTAFTVGGNEQTGLNDLEGSVLLEAEDYRRIAQEVKALKTMLLRFKRELNEVSGLPPSTPADSKMINDIIFAEKDKSQEEIASLQKEGKAKDTKIEALTSEVSQLKAENLKLTESLKELETHRNGLLEKVERLHADKHKLEDRLKCLESSHYYELSESICVESLQEEDLDGSLLMVDDENSDLGDVSNSAINTSGEGIGSSSLTQT